MKKRPGESPAFAFCGCATRAVFKVEWPQRSVAAARADRVRAGYAITRTTDLPSAHSSGHGHPVRSPQRWTLPNCKPAESRGRRSIATHESGGSAYGQRESSCSGRCSSFLLARSSHASAYACAEARSRETPAWIIGWEGVRLAARGSSHALKSQVVCWMSGVEWLSSEATE